MCALNWRNHPEKDKEERERREREKGERQRERQATAEMGEFLLHPLWGYSAFSSAQESTAKINTQAIKVNIHIDSYLFPVFHSANLCQNLL